MRKRNNTSRTKALTIPPYIIKKADSWLKDWNIQEKKALLLYGDQGVGKTTLAYHIAKKHHYEVCEYNASDDRSKEFFATLSTQSCTLSLSKNLILLDEIDGTTTNTSQLIKIFQTTQKPIILTANSLKRIYSLLKHCTVIKVTPPTFSTLSSILPLSTLKTHNIHDYRQAYSIASCNSHSFTPTISDRKEKLLKMISSGDYSQIDPKTSTDLIYLLDSTPQLYGYFLVEFLLHLALYDRTKRPSVLTGLTPAITKITPTWFAKKNLAPKK